MTQKNNDMATVRVDSRKMTFPLGTTLLEIAETVRDDYPYDILAATVNSRLEELSFCVTEDCSVTFLTAATVPGFQIYERSTVMLMLKAFYDILGTDRLKSVTVDFSVSRSLFCRAKGDFVLDEALLSRIEESMRRLVEEDVPFVKSNIATDDAIRLFRRYGMRDKERLFGFRRNSRANIYELAGFQDYFYGYMVPSTKYLRYFGLQPYHEGFILRLPTPDTPETLEPFEPSEKEFKELYDTTVKAEGMDLGSVAGLNWQIAGGRTRELILCQEALMEKQIGVIADRIAERKDVRFVMIAGPSSSGKTTFSNRLSTQLRALGLKPHPIECDNYFKKREDTPKDEKGQYDFECLEAMDVELFNSDMSRLLNGERVEIPTFSFASGPREYKGDFLEIGEKDILVIEGIHCLNDALSYALPKESKFRIYISCLTQMNIDEHNRIPTTDARLLRRMVRDARTRGTSARETLKRWPSVGRGELKNIFPYRDSADVIFNSAMTYETAVLKSYAEALLFGIPKDSPESIEAKRLLKFLNYFLAIPSDDIPATSILREFVGGGVYLG